MREEESVENETDSFLRKGLLQPPLWRSRWVWYVGGCFTFWPGEGSADVSDWASLANPVCGGTEIVAIQGYEGPRFHSAKAMGNLKIRRKVMKVAIPAARI